MKQTFTLLILFLFASNAFSQDLFSEDFESVTLQDGAAFIPDGWVTQNRDGQMALAFAGNAPFHLPQYNLRAWAVSDFSLPGVKAAISTALHGPIDNITDRWLISPKVEGIGGKSHLFWKGFTDSGEALDKCQIWVTSTIAGSEPNAEDFLVDPNQEIHSFRMMPDEFNTYAIDLSDFEGQDIYFAIRNVSFIPARVILDDFEIKDAVEDDISVKALAMEPYFVSGPTEVKVDIVNMSPEPVENITLSYQVNGAGPITTETFNVSLTEITEQTQLAFDSWVDLPEGGHDVEVWVEKVNGNDDTKVENNTKQGFISLMNDPPAKRILIQEYTGAWCGWCPAGTLVLKQIAGGDPTFVPVAVHSGDQMEFFESGLIANAATSNYPSASFDFNRFPGEAAIGVGRNQWFDRAAERLNAIVPATVEVESHTYNRDTRELEVTVKTDFIGAAKEALRLNVWIIEEEVTGPPNESGNNGWNNANFDNTNINSPFYNLGNPLPPDAFKHEHVFNATLTGAWGDDTVFPAEINPGESFSATYNFTLPEAQGAEQHWKAEDIHVVAFLSRYNLNPKKRSVLNATRGITFLTGIGNVIEEVATTKISPNPVRDMATLEVTMKEASSLDIRIFNQLGLEVLTSKRENFLAGKTNIELSLAELPAGIYFVSLYNNKGGIHTERVIVQR